MKTTNAAKKQTSQLEQVEVNQMENTATKNKSHIKIAKPRPTGTDASVQGPRDCFPLG